MCRITVDVRPTRHRPLLLVTPPKQWAEGQGIGRNATQYMCVCVRARTRTRSRTYSCVRCKYTESQLQYSAPSVYFFVPLSSCCYPQCPFPPTPLSEGRSGPTPISYIYDGCRFTCPPPIPSLHPTLVTKQHCI